jgi:tryptophanyl-tRNA synthetase
MEVRRSPEKPGVTNLIGILSVASGRSEAEIEVEFAGSGYGDFKTAVADAVAEYLRPVREAYPEIRGDEAEIERILGAGADQAREIAAGTLKDVRAAMGVGAPS